jgi:CheY-like chemotaxis protein
MTLTGLHILLAEDNPTNQLVAVQMLESLGARVTLARDGAEALRIACEQVFDVGLIDIEMPRVSGTDVILTIRRGSGAQADMPLIALTAYVMNEHRAQIDAAGADGVIAKPILSIQKLGEDILVMMERRRTGSARARARAGTPAAPEATLDAGSLEALAASVGEEALPLLLRTVVSDLEMVRDRIKAALHPCDLAEMRQTIHILMAVGGVIGAAALQDGARCLNSAAHSEKLSQIDHIAPSILAEIEQVIAVLCDRI